MIDLFISAFVTLFVGIDPPSAPPTPPIAAFDILRSPVTGSVTQPVSAIAPMLVKMVSLIVLLFIFSLPYPADASDPLHTAHTCR